MKAQTKKALRYCLKPFGLVVFAYILWKIDLRLLAKGLASVNLWLFALAYMVATPMQFLKALRWRQLVQANPGAKLSFVNSTMYSFAVGFLGTVTPGRVGELYKISYVQARGLSFGRSTATVIVDRVFDVIVPLVIACLGILLHPRMPGAAFRQVAMLLVIAAMAIVAIYMLKTRLQNLAMRFIQKFSGSDRTQPVGRAMEEFLLAIKAVRVRDWLFCLLLTLGVWAMYCGQRLIMCSAIGMDIDVSYFCVVFFAVALVSALPISIAGIGTRDAALIYLLGRAGVSRENAVVLSSLILGAMLLNTLLSFAAFMLVPSAKSLHSAAAGVLEPGSPNRKAED